VSLVSESSEATQMARIMPETVVSLADAVAGSIRDAILSRRLKAGERIFQDRVAEELGVSRQPVREALKRLQAEGLVRELGNRRVIVREYSHSDVSENYLLRRTLESEATRIAATALTDTALDDLAAVNANLDRVARTGDTTGILDLNERFHRLIWRSTELPTLQGFIESLWMGLTIATPLSIPGRMLRSVEEHEAILRALRARDPERAAQAMAQHIEEAAHEFLASHKTAPS
jgi:DNA-binding GntR family transcriptional regulator